MEPAIRFSLASSDLIIWGGVAICWTILGLLLSRRAPIILLSGSPAGTRGALQCCSAVDLRIAAVLTSAPFQSKYILTKDAMRCWLSAIVRAHQV